MEQTTSTTASGDQGRPDLTQDDVKSDLMAESTPQPTSEVPPAASKSPSNPPPSSTDGSSMPSHPATAPKKKGTAATVKKAPKRPKNGGPKAAKKRKPTSSGDTPQDPGSDDDEEDNGPYCLCRGPDDHRWMIFCEKCEDWFHGECINLSKEVGEALIERFICPNCTKGNAASLYKKTCALNNCRKAARLGQENESIFCSSEHAQTWWERMLARLPKTKSKGGFNDQLVQEEFMALLASDLSGLGEDGAWKLVKTPFGSAMAKSGDKATDDEQLSNILSEEEKEFLDAAAKARVALAEETLLCHKMLTLIEFAQERRRAAITAGRFGEDICGYDQRLDTISARDAFAAFAKSSEGEAIFKASKLGDPDGEDDEVRGMCEKKRCKIHSGWQKMLVLGIKNQIRDMAGQAAEVEEEERVMREAAIERFRRLKAEKNWVEVFDG